MPDDGELWVVLRDFVRFVVGLFVVENDGETSETKCKVKKWAQISMIWGLVVDTSTI
jgi:hypothetical protein